MAINYAKLRSLTARKIIAALLAEGFVFDRQRGSHRQYKHPVKHGRVTVPGKLSKDIPPGTLGSVLKQAELK